MEKPLDKFVNPALPDIDSLPVSVIRRRVKYSRVEFQENGLTVIVPPGVDPTRILKENKKSILKKYLKMMHQINASKNTPTTDRSEAGFLRIVSHYSEYYSQELNVKIKVIKFRKMRRRWGSCRRDGSITLNAWLRFVPEHLIAYIVFHELSHMRVRNHGKKFKDLIASEFPNYRKLDKELSLYGLKLLK
jgi:predicted metal-dependent hydrolase